jgi:excisionase family DNA binding protein
MSDSLTTEEASKLSGYSITHLQDLIRRKKIEAEKKGGAYWVNRASLVAYIEEAESSKDKDKRHGARKKSKTSG